jgi:hypothetical protein
MLRIWIWRAPYTLLALNEEKKLLLKNGETPGGGQSETSPFRHGTDPEVLCD